MERLCYYLSMNLQMIHSLIILRYYSRLNISICESLGLFIAFQEYEDEYGCKSPVYFGQMSEAYRWRLGELTPISKKPDPLRQFPNNLPESLRPLIRIQPFLSIKSTRPAFETQSIWGDAREAEHLML